MDKDVRTDSQKRRVHTILVADDDEQIRQLVWEILATEGLRVLPARNGEEALEILAKQGGGVDLLLADVVMPRMGGAELAKEAQVRFPKLKILFMSGYGDVEAFHDEFPDAADRVLEKPFVPATLVDLVQAALRARK
jgi:DNA-binding NtrC family response regulator